MLNNVSKILQKLWYGNFSFLRILFSPLLILSLVYYLIIRIKSQKKKYIPGVFTIVIGNLTVGGVGKSSLVMELARFLDSKGFNVGVITRGYKSAIEDYEKPFTVMQEHNCSKVGDEPYLIKHMVNAEVVIDDNRLRGIEALKKLQCDVIISDDGLQNYHIDYQIKVLLVDGTRGYGNSFVLPYGPLRETESMVKERVDYRVVVDYQGDDLGIIDFEKYKKANYKACEIIDVFNGKIYSIEDWIAGYSNNKIIAKTAIGNANRFFNLLILNGINMFQKLEYIDHYQFNDKDFQDEQMVYLITQKDAVKVKNFLKKEGIIFYLKVNLIIDSSFYENIYKKLKNSILQQ